MNTLKGKINLIFSVALILLLLLFFASFAYQKEKSLEDFVNQERANSHYLYLYYLKYQKIDESYLESQNIRLVKGQEQKVIIGKFSKDPEGKTHYQVMTYRYKRFILIDNERFKLLLENMNKPQYTFKTVLLFMGLLILLMLLYFWIIKSLSPLTELKEKIKTFSEGNLDIECRSNKQDEIAAVANEFDHAVKMIKELIHSRQLFLRAIMHELKTPIAKGRLVSEMVDDEKQKERLHRIFVRLNLLIDEFAKLERLTSKNFHLHIKDYPASRLLQEGIDMLMLESNQESITTTIVIESVIHADRELFALVVKNLIDNALKYSNDHHASIIVDEESIEIANRGEPLPYALEEYYAPFHHSDESLGLGLYIVKSILEILQMDLEYRYEDDSNYFSIRFIR